MQSTKLKQTYFTNQSTLHPRISNSRQINSQYQTPSIHQSQLSSRRPKKFDILVYCPVCKRDYLSSQIEEHTRVHDNSDTYDFSVLSARSPTQPQIHQQRLTRYPLVEPLEFHTSQLKQTEKKDKFIYKDRQIYDGVDQSYFKPKRDVGVQTLKKPPLQYQSSKYNLFNCFDNAFNEKGPGFSVEDVTSNNDMLADKRELNEWERAKLHQQRNRR